MFEFIKRYRQRRIMRHLLQTSRSKKISNIEDVRTVGIVFTVGDKELWDVLYHFAKNLEHSGKTVWMAGMQHNHTTINYIFTHSQMVICHEKENLDFAGIPKPGVMDDFFRQHYDLLIDTTMEPDFFGKYVSLHSTADLKTTYINDNDTADPEIEKIFDLHIHGSKPIDIPAYLADIVKYLSMIKK